MKCKHCSGSIESERLRMGKKYCKACDPYMPKPVTPAITSPVSTWTPPPYYWNRPPVLPYAPGGQSQPQGQEATTITPMLYSHLTMQKGPVIERYARLNDIDTLVETGTAYGEMIDFLKDKFTKIHSIELSESFYNGVVMRFINNPNIHLHHGDSGQVLGRVLKGIDKPVIFWLDAHYSGGWTAKGSKDTPIMDELAAIYKSGLNHIILIDDSRMFGFDMAYPTRAELTAFILGKNPVAVIEWLPEDIIAITPAEKPKKVQQYKRSKSCQISTMSEIYQKEFKGKTNGVFVDVGAYDGHTFSNTWGLAVAGWRGVCFEPVPEFAAKCREQYKYYPGVKVIEAAAGAKDGKALLYLGLCPTINVETMQKDAWGFGYDPAQTLLVPVVTLNTALAQLSIPHKFDVLSIDVEGAELEVLDGLDFHIWNPRMVILEVNKTHPVPSYHIHTEQIDARMLAAGFTEIYSDAINSIYVR